MLLPGSTWGYEVKIIVDALTDHCQRNKNDSTRTYVWICFACINQHRVQELLNLGHSVPPEQFAREFENRVVSTGHVLSLVAPWSFSCGRVVALLRLSEYPYCCSLVTLYCCFLCSSPMAMLWLPRCSPVALL